MKQLSYQFRRGMTEINRELQKDERKDFWNLARAIAEVEEGSEEYERLHIELQAQVSTWTLGPPFYEDKADKYRSLHALWYDVDIAGEATGLREVIERLKHKDPEEPKESVEFLLAAGRALNNGAILAYDLHPTPPVVIDDE